MGIIKSTISLFDTDDIFFLTNTMWKYNMITLTGTYNVMYYGLKYGWKFRNRIYNKLTLFLKKLWIKSNTKNILYY